MPSNASAGKITQTRERSKVFRERPYLNDGFEPICRYHLSGLYLSSFLSIQIPQTCSTDPLKGDVTENLSWNVWFFFVAQLLHGAGASPLFTLGE